MLQDYGVVPELSSVMLLGEPDWAACASLASALIRSAAPCDDANGDQPPAAAGERERTRCHSDMPRLPKVWRMLFVCTTTCV